MKSYLDIILRCNLVAYDCLGMINHNFTQQFCWPNMKVLIMKNDPSIFLDYFI
jgi:hypothetical protein